MLSQILNAFGKQSTLPWSLHVGRSEYLTNPVNPIIFQFNIANIEGHVKYQTKNAIKRSTFK